MVCIMDLFFGPFALVCLRAAAKGVTAHQGLAAWGVIFWAQEPVALVCAIWGLSGVIWHPRRPNPLWLALLWCCVFSNSSRGRAEGDISCVGLSSQGYRLSPSLLSPELITSSSQQESEKRLQPLELTPSADLWLLTDGHVRNRAGVKASCVESKLWPSLKCQTILCLKRLKSKSRPSPKRFGFNTKPSPERFKSRSRFQE